MGEVRFLLWVAHLLRTKGNFCPRPGRTTCHLFHRLNLGWGLGFVSLGFEVYWFVSLGVMGL